jgi:membrane protease subunit (stomatin/prohibitin family)
MALFGNKNKPNKGGLIADMIQSPEQNRDWLIYKWRPAGEEAGSTKRENSIRFSSSITVRQGEAAVFLYTTQRQSLTGQSGTGQTIGGAPLDFIEGYWQGGLKTANLPILAGILGAAFGGGTPFPAQVYFINAAGVNQVQFGVPYFSMFDPRLPDHPVDVAVRGAITFRIADYKQFINLHALVDFDMEKFKAQIKNAVIDHVQNSMMDIQVKLGRPLIQINTYRREIRTMLQSDIGASLSSTFGISLGELNISAIEIDQESPGYAQLAKLTKDVTSAKIEQQADLSLRGMEDQYDLNKKNIEGMSAINMENMQDGMRRSREEAQYAQHTQTDMGGFALHQLRQQEEIAKAAAGAMGQMGQGAGVSMGNGGGFNPGAMVAGMAMGGAVGQGMAGMMGNVFNQMGQGMPQIPGQTPPPIPGGPVPGGPPPIPGAPPALQFSVAVNGQTFGPYDMNALSQMAAQGQFNAQSMVWRQGMAGWQAAGTVPELAPLFAGASAPPPPPPPPPVV